MRTRPLRPDHDVHVLHQTAISAIYYSTSSIDLSTQVTGAQRGGFSIDGHLHAAVSRDGLTTSTKPILIDIPPHTDPDTIVPT